ncbi:MAG: DNA cytosine methyltransferase [Deltaproteobacteria bacterium]|nr:MAG: DNA cytosine methyltransferase [Deltaproteobacteria bacterium]
MRVLIACEFSGIVRDAFTKKGHDVISCDFLPTEIPGPHYQGDIFDIINDQWDLMVAFPPCTHLAVSGARWFAEKQKDGRQQEGIDFFISLTQSHIDKIAIENPVGIMSTYYKKPDQIIQPYEFGDPFQKKTCLWLKGLVKLKPTNIVKEREQKCWKEPPGPERWKNRSRTYKGIAEAMAVVWG